MVALAHGASQGCERAADNGGRLGEDLACHLARQVGGDDGAGHADHQTPSGRAVGLADELDRPEQGRRLDFQTAEAPRHRHAEQTGLGHRAGEVGGEAPRFLDLPGARAHALLKRLRTSHNVHRHSGSRRRAAMLFRCMFDDPPTMGITQMSRT